ncbi:MAG: hydantoinase [Blastopirellula sp.]|nr:MAG: hydantoinase [Blastopirellula sp.]
MDEPKWQFWIDVGGTFTDCFAVTPSGDLLRHKLLSSGKTKGIAGPQSTTQIVVDTARVGDPIDFWVGFQIHFLNDSGQVVESRTITAFDASQGSLTLDRPLSVPVPGTRYELDTELEAPVLAIRWLLACPLKQPIPAVQVRLGTTRGTNALLTRTGAKTAFVTTAGFADVLRIGYQNRPRLFDLNIKKPESLFVTSVEVDERMTADGTVLQALNIDQAREVFRQLKLQSIQSVAICLMNAYANDVHEQQLKNLAKEAGLPFISLSSEVVPLMKIVSRGDTTVVDAYLGPILQDYIDSIKQELGQGSSLRLMTSAGALVDVEHFSGKDSVLSGPAGGVVGFAAVAQAAGFARSIGFDMGGTSTDVSRFDGEYCYEHETEKAGVRIVAPMMAIETVAAGGGSICSFDGVKLVVGPQSAGADPGPACYGRGGPLTVTDMNYFLGKILPEHFPFPLDRIPVENQLGQLCEDIAEATETNYSSQQLAEGFLRIADQNMAKAIRSVSIAQGVDPRDYALVAFGGAAPQHACSVAKELRIPVVLNHPDSGILSAYGIGQASVAAHRVQGVYQLLNMMEENALLYISEKLKSDAVGEVCQQGIAPDQIQVKFSLDLRYQGQDAVLNVSFDVELDHAGQILDHYQAKHVQHYGYKQEQRPVEVVSLRVIATGTLREPPEPCSHAQKTTPRPADHTTVFFDGKDRQTPVYERFELVAGNCIKGPAIVVEVVSTTVIDPGWVAEVMSDQTLLLTRSDQGRTTSISTAADPIMLEVFNNLFAGIAERMGITLQNTSSSVNVKERLDFSCALFTAAGDLVVNAPHILVHLGAMGETVQHILHDNPQMQAGDVFVTNDPFRGGSHLPDVTVVTPVFDTQNELLFLTASRAHHAEIGGITPGSMPPFSKNLAEEGVLIRNFKLIAAGESRADRLAEILQSGQYPSRAVSDNLADIQAQVAANQNGATQLLDLVEQYGIDVVKAYMNHIQNAAEQKTRNALARLADGHHQFTDHLDDDTPISVDVHITGDQAVIDFTGTGPVSAGNLNANRAIVSSAVLYVMRVLISEDIPLNQGVLKPVEIILPTGILDPPVHAKPEDCAAVVGGNVETSQRVVDVLFGALNLAAASQGTMNNFLFGDKSFGYYETIGGGSGASPTANGADAVHTHMTNTRLTDPEIFERRYPVRLKQFAIRKDSGGAGEYQGGNGIVRRIEFLKPLEVSLLTQRRAEYVPYGLEGGMPGASGINTLKRSGQPDEELPSQVKLNVEPGDELTIKTPGGGGFGKSS